MALLKTSKVKSVQANGTWEGKFGLMYKFEVEMENGNVGEYSSKTKDQEKFVVGEEVQYEFVDGKFPKIKPYYNKDNYSFTKGGDNLDRQKAINRWAGLGRAIDYLGASASEEQLYKQAERFIEWVNEKQKETLNNNSTADNWQKHHNSSNDDLPF